MASGNVANVALIFGLLAFATEASRSLLWHKQPLLSISFADGISSQAPAGIERASKTKHHDALPHPRRIKLTAADFLDDEVQSAIDRVSRRDVVALDSNGDGRISLAEFAAALAAEANAEGQTQPPGGTHPHFVASGASSVQGEGMGSAHAAKTSSVCGELGNLHSCANNEKCFPHYECQGAKQTMCKGSCVPAEIVECLKASQDARKLMLYLSDGLSDNDLRNALRQLVLELPAEAWNNPHEELDARLSNELNFDSLADTGFREEELYQGLSVLVIADACYTKRFESEDKRWPCEDFKPVLVEMGFDLNQVKSVYLMDLVLEGKSDKLELEDKLRELFTKEDHLEIDPKIASTLITHGEALQVDTLLDGVDIIAVNGGDPDFVAFAMTKLVPGLDEAIRTRVEAGSLIFMGRSAGAMAGGADVSLSTEPPPSLSISLLGCSTKGLELAGHCAIRPHYSQKSWDKASETYERARGLNVVRIPNGEGMMCAQGVCKMVGMRHKTIYDSRQSPARYEAIEGAIPHREGQEADELFKERGNYCSSRETVENKPKAQKSGTQSPPVLGVVPAAVVLALSFST